MICEKCKNQDCTCPNEKPFEQKNILERYTIDGKYNVAGAFLELEAKNKQLTERVLGLEEAMIFFSDWYNRTQRPNILLKEDNNTDGSKKIIL